MNSLKSKLFFNKKLSFSLKQLNFCKKKWIVYNKNNPIIIFFYIFWYRGNSKFNLIF